MCLRQNAAERPAFEYTQNDSEEIVFFWDWVKQFLEFPKGATFHVAEETEETVHPRIALWQLRQPHFRFFPLQSPGSLPVGQNWVNSFF